MNKYLCVHIANDGSINIYPTYSPLGFYEYALAYMKSEKLQSAHIAGNHAGLYNDFETVMITKVITPEQ
jgi:hypothetical protein